MRMLGWGLLFGFLAVFLTLVFMPGDTDIDVGWKYMWIALALGFVGGAFGSWYRRRKVQR